MTIASDPPMEWRVTFGQQYRHEPHPTWHDAHPDGWLAVSARSEAQARAAVMARIGQHWAFMYAMGDAFQVSTRSDDGGDGGTWAEIYPRGELGRITA